MKTDFKQHPTKEIKLSDITFYGNNPTIHSPDQIQKIKKSIHEFGMFNYIGVDKNNLCVFGEGRARALKTDFENLGKTLTVFDLSSLNPKQIKKVRVIDNSYHEGFDEGRLMKAIEDIYSNVEENLGGIEEELNLDISKMFKQIEKEVDAKPRSGSLKVISVILEFQKKDHDFYLEQMNIQMKKHNIQTISDMVLKLLEDAQNG